MENINKETETNFDQNKLLKEIRAYVESNWKYKEDTGKIMEEMMLIKRTFRNIESINPIENEDQFWNVIEIAMKDTLRGVKKNCDSGLRNLKREFNATK